MNRRADVSDAIADAFWLAYHRALQMPPAPGDAEPGQTTNATGRVVGGNPTQAHRALCVRDCGRPRDPAAGRGLCRVCHRHLTAAGELDQYTKYRSGPK
jgi:ribosomal protein S14